MEVFFPCSSKVDRRFAVEFVELRERMPSLVAPATVTPFVVEHASGVPAYALRVEYGGKVITYSGDTEWTESLVEAARWLRVSAAAVGDSNSGPADQHYRPVRDQRGSAPRAQLPWCGR